MLRIWDSQHTSKGKTNSSVLVLLCCILARGFSHGLELIACISERRPQEFFISHWWTPSMPRTMQEPDVNFVTKHLLPMHSMSYSNTDFATSERHFFQLSQSHFFSTEEGAHGKTEVLRESISELSEHIHSAWRIFLKNGKKNFLKERKRGFLYFGSMKTGQTEFHKM